MTTSATTRLIDAFPDAVYQAFVDPALLVKWQAPDNMTAKLHHFDPRPGGGYEMSLFYNDPSIAGKSGANEDRYTATFIELVQPRHIVESIVFATDDPAFAEPMIVTIDLESEGASTRVTMTFENLPPNVSPADNDLGTRQSLAKLARLVESDSSLP
ncbi:MAG TPA: SRPBCC domain-containing protein [Thermomicrobiales bacterium]|nr:SRPBCC domain-containing protein [Thermomicrobiales bacterium]